MNSKANYDQALSELEADEQKKAKKAKREEKKFYGGGKRGRMIRKMKKNGHRVNNENKIKEAERAKRQADIDAKKEKAASKRRAQKERLRAIARRDADAAEAFERKRREAEEEEDMSGLHISSRILLSKAARSISTGGVRKCSSYLLGCLLLACALGEEIRIHLSERFIYFIALRISHCSAIT